MLPDLKTVLRRWIPLADGTPVDSVVPRLRVSLERSLSPCLIVYDTALKPLIGDGLFEAATLLLIVLSEALLPARK